MMVVPGAPLRSRLGRRRALLQMAAFCIFIFSYFPPAPAQQKTPGSREPDRIAAQADQARAANDLDRALTLYRKALGMRPGWAEGWWSLGTIMYDRDNYAEAARAFERVVALQPQHGSARVMLGLCEFELGQDASALRDIEKGKQLGVLKDPQLRHVVLYHEGVLLHRKERFEGAQEAFQALCKEGVQNDELTRALGMVALRIRGPNSPASGTPGGEIVTRVGLAECLAAQKRFDEARGDFSDLAKKYTAYPNIHYAFGRFLLETRDTTTATQEFEQEIKNNPDHVMARLEIAAVKYRIDSAAGLPYAEEAVKLDPKLPIGHYLLGLLLLDTNNYQKALPELEIARGAFPREPTVYYALGTAYSRAGRKQEAARARATFVRLNQETGNEPKPTYYGQESSGAAQVIPGGETRVRPQQ